MTEETDDIPDLFDGIEDGTDDDVEGEREDVWTPQIALPEPLSEVFKLALVVHSDESQVELEQRPRGILSPTDREYLYGMKDYAHAQSEAKRKQDIRKRVEHALKDFSLLWLLWDKDERKQVFDEMGNETVENSIESVITFLYLSLEQDTYRLEERIECGILRGANASPKERSAGRAINVDVSVDIEYDPDVDAIHERLRNGEGDQLTVEEIGVLVRAGKLDAEDLAELDDRTSISLDTNKTDSRESTSVDSNFLDNRESNLLNDSENTEK